ncbi:TnsD family Tn7-like transposition protein [Castellaniella sp. FW104-16D08]|uniref:TnsD family Tn7-like transposition protein n=1 Tax=unclassified Castellaniella TaxID=2617606 RepID=UPI003314E172
MLNFPVPYPDELLYSVVARAGVRHGLISPKQLLGEVFGSRGVIATLDLPNQLSALLRWLPDGFTLEKLIYEHTLFPIYAPFVPEDRRKRCMMQMAGRAHGAVHLALGVAASRIKIPSYIRYCPGCLAGQQAQRGEYFWQRAWQVAGVDMCPDHGMLVEAHIARPAVQRHRFIAASPDYCPAVEQPAGESASLWVERQVRQLLRLPARPSPSPDQWTAYYRHLAGQLGLCRGQSQIDHRQVRARVMQIWPVAWLARFHFIGEASIGSESDWLVALFCKHRKSFSYLQHIVVNHALLDGSWQIREVIERARRYPANSVSRHTPSCADDRQEIDGDQSRWISLLTQSTPKQARRLDPALYARLYRKRHGWLLEVNRQYVGAPPARRTPRVDWHQRDTQYCLALQHLAAALQADNHGPRRSKSYYLKQLGGRSTIEKNLYKMPLLATFLSDRAESIAQYQLRRLHTTYEALRKEFLTPPRWRLLRGAGLNEQRLKEPARGYLEKLSIAHEIQRH